MVETEEEAAYNMPLPLPVSYSGSSDFGRFLLTRQLCKYYTTFALSLIILVPFHIHV
jgi:hypothetical protein